MLSACMRNHITLDRHSVEGNFLYTLADSFRIGDSDFINGSAEAAAHGIFLPLRAYSRIYFKTFVPWLYS